MTVKLELVRERAKKVGIKGEIKHPTKKGEKYMITNDYGTIHFGATGYEDYLDHKDMKRRNNFHHRFARNPGYTNKSSGLYYSRMLLW